MKRVKIALTAIALFAVVGGALAFKASRYGATIYCANPADNNICNLEVANRTLVKQGTQAGVDRSCVAAEATTTCASVKIYTLQ